RAADRAAHLRMPTATRGVADVHLADAPPGACGAQNHLERPAEPAVEHAQREQLLTPGGAHRADVPQLESRASAQLERQNPVGQTRVRRPRVSGYSLAGAEHEVGL